MKKTKKPFKSDLIKSAELQRNPESKSIHNTFRRNRPFRMPPSVPDIFPPIQVAALKRVYKRLGCGGVGCHRYIVNIAKP